MSLYPCLSCVHISLSRRWLVIWEAVDIGRFCKRGYIYTHTHICRYAHWIFSLRHLTQTHTLTRPHTIKRENHADLCVHLYPVLPFEVLFSGRKEKKNKGQEKTKALTSKANPKPCLVSSVITIQNDQNRSDPDDGEKNGHVLLAISRHDADGVAADNSHVQQGLGQELGLVVQVREGPSRPRPGKDEEFALREVCRLEVEHLGEREVQEGGVQGAREVG